MRVLVLWADEHSTNLGVRALAAGTAELLRQVWPDADIAFHNFGQRNPHLSVGTLRSLLKERVVGTRGTRRWLASFDLIVDTRSGDSFADIYGLRRLSIMSAVAEFACEAGTPVVLGPQTIGPFTTLRGRSIARFSLARAAIVMARDSESARYAASVGRRVDTLTSDVVFALPQPVPSSDRDVLLNVSGLLWNSGPHVDAAAYRRAVTDLYRELTSRGRQVSLLAHVLDSDRLDNDLPAMRELARTIAPDVELLVPGGLEEVRSMVASCRLVIGSRMHACLNALSVGTPAIPLAYSRKFEPLLADLGWRRTVDLRRNEHTVALALRHSEAPELDREAAEVRQRAAPLLDRAHDALKNLNR